jgi:hypothetical protein
MLHTPCFDAVAALVPAETGERPIRSGDHGWRVDRTPVQAFCTPRRTNAGQEHCAGMQTTHARATAPIRR